MFLISDYIVLGLGCVLFVFCFVSRVFSNKFFDFIWDSLIGNILLTFAIALVISPFIFNLFLNPCHSCQKYVRSDYCTACGSYVAADSFCSCGAELDERYSFCPSCGLDLDVSYDGERIK